MRWHAHAAVAGSKYLGVVEADTQEEAERKAWELDSACVNLCHHCSDECEDGEVTRIECELVGE
jgi:hypothetical protein